MGQKMLGAAAAVALSLGAVSGVAYAGEFDVLTSNVPVSYILDDAKVLSKSTKGTLNTQLKSLEVQSHGWFEWMTV